MSTISMILEPDPDGTLHLPLPEELRHGKVKVQAELEAVQVASTSSPLQSPRLGMTAPKAGSLKGFLMAPDFDAPLPEFREYME